VITTQDYDDCNWACGRAYLSKGIWQGMGSFYRESSYRHPFGIVEIYEQTGSNPITNMRFRHNGRDWCRTWRTTWGDRTLSRLARGLVEAVTS
jgi:hypothetical protein